MSLGSRRLCNDQPLYPNNDVALVSAWEWSRVTFYHQHWAPPQRNEQPPASAANLTRGTFNGYISPATRRRLRRCLGTWLRSIYIYRRDLKKRWDPGKPYPVFLTVTLPSPQQHTDQEINRHCLQPFIQALGRTHNVTHYFWRAEAQENGNVHYHILADRFICKEDLQYLWNKHANTLGYVDRYFDATGEANPPSTEIHRLRDKIKDPKSGKWRSCDPVTYLLGYLMATPEIAPDADPNAKPGTASVRLVGTYYDKKGQKQTYHTRPVGGRCWGMSSALRDIKPPRAEATSQTVATLILASEAGRIRRVDTDRATMFFGPIAEVLQRHNPQAYACIYAYYIRIFSHLYPSALPRSIPLTASAPPLQSLWLDFSDPSLLNLPCSPNQPPRRWSPLELLGSSLPARNLRTTQRKPSPSHAVHLAA